MGLQGRACANWAVVMTGEQADRIIHRLDNDIINRLDKIEAAIKKNTPTGEADASSVQLDITDLHGDKKRLSGNHTIYALGFWIPLVVAIVHFW